MTGLSSQQIQIVTNFRDFVSTPFSGDVNAICWKRELQGDFEEIVRKVEFHTNMIELSAEELNELQLSEEGQLAREVILNDLELLKAHGTSPTLNIIRYYERDNSYPFFPTDVYSFHVDRSPVPTDTILCTYYGTSSDIIQNSEVEQKILVPEIRAELKRLYNGPEEGFESFLQDHFFDLHYQPKPHAQPVNLGPGNIWRLAVDHPNSKVLPCVHRAPLETNGESRLLLIC